jgi:hypothetical protein
VLDGGIYTERGLPCIFRNLGELHIKQVNGVESLPKRHREVAREHIGHPTPVSQGIFHVFLSIRQLLRGEFLNVATKRVSISVEEFGSSRNPALNCTQHEYKDGLS